jgi:integrase
MPARQRGFARKRGNAWLAGWYTDGRQVTRGGFATRTDALDYANVKADDAVARKAAAKFGDKQPVTSNIETVDDLVGAFLARHRVDEATVRKLRSQLKHATSAFGDRRIETLTSIELDVWRSQLPARSAHYMFRAFRQVLEYAVAMGMLDVNPTARIKNTRATVERRAIHPFETWEQVEAISAEMDPRFAAIPIVLVGTGLRPEELFALERRDVDLDAGVLTVERVFTQGC